jgi:hypothetical protein
MLLVLASIADQYVTAGIELWRAKRVAADVVTCHDLAQPGWQLTLDGDPTLVVAGEPVPAKQVDAVITRIACVTPFELPFVAPEDRAYAAAEMHAFLAALLDALKCPVLNKPTSGCLCGPALSREQWVALAVKAGVAAAPAVRNVYAGGDVVAAAAPPRTTVHVVADKAYNSPGPTYSKAAVAIAKAANAELLRVYFDASAPKPLFLDADAWVDVSDPAIADAIRKRVS